MRSLAFLLRAFPKPMIRSIVLYSLGLKRKPETMIFAIVSTVYTAKIANNV